MPIKIMNPMYASNSSTVICCHELNFSPRHSDAYLLLWYTMWSRTEVVKKRKKMSFTVVGMSTRGPVCWLKDSRENDVSSDDHCMFSALYIVGIEKQDSTLCPVQFQIQPCVMVYVFFLHSVQVSIETESSLCGRACSLHGWACSLHGWVCSLHGWVCSLHGWACSLHGWVCSLRGWVCSLCSWVFPEQMGMLPPQTGSLVHFM